jgi:hypothetical protein
MKKRAGAGANLSKLNFFQKLLKQDITLHSYASLQAHNALHNSSQLANGCY